jgi:SlyX protein
MTEIERLNTRIDALEMRLAHQDQTADDLNEALTAQWKVIDDLTRQVARLEAQLQEVRDSAGGADGPEPPPPHY